MSVGREHCMFEERQMDVATSVTEMLTGSMN